MIRASSSVQETHVYQIRASSSVQETHVYQIGVDDAHVYQIGVDGSVRGKCSEEVHGPRRVRLPTSTDHAAGAAAGVHGPRRVRLPKSTDHGGSGCRSPRTTAGSAAEVHGPRRVRLPKSTDHGVSLHDFSVSVFMVICSNCKFSFSWLCSKLQVAKA